MYRLLLFTSAGVGAAGCAAALPESVDADIISTPWNVVSIREPSQDDLPFEEATHYLWPSTNPNDVVGPDSLRAFVRTNEDSRPQIYVENLRTGTTDLLFAGYAFLPRWSPDGRYIACTEWKSVGRYSDLTLVEVASKRVVPGPVAAATFGEKWSPDGRGLLATGVQYGIGHAVLYIVRLPDFTPHVVDTTALVANYEYSWSPDSRWIAYTRPTAIDRTGGDTVAADVWIASPATGSRWLLLETPEWIDADPLWIDNHRILIERTHWNGTSFGAVEHKVLVLQAAEPSRPSP